MIHEWLASDSTCVLRRRRIKIRTKQRTVGRNWWQRVLSLFTLCCFFFYFVPFETMKLRKWIIVYDDKKSLRCVANCGSCKVHKIDESISHSCRLLLSLISCWFHFIFYSLLIFSIDSHIGRPIRFESSKFVRNISSFFVDFKNRREIDVRRTGAMKRGTNIKWDRARRSSRVHAQTTSWNFFQMKLIYMVYRRRRSASTKGKFSTFCVHFVFLFRYFDICLVDLHVVHRWLAQITIITRACVCERALALLFVSITNSLHIPFRNRDENWNRMAKMHFRNIDECVTFNLYCVVNENMRKQCRRPHHRIFSQPNVCACFFWANEFSLF